MLIRVDWVTIATMVRSKRLPHSNINRESWGFVSYTRNSIGNVATRTNVSNSMSNNKVRAADLFKFVHTTR